MTLFEDFFSCCMTSFVAKKQFGTGVASFFKLIEETDSQKTNSFLCGSMAWIQTIVTLEAKKRLLRMY